MTMTDSSTNPANDGGENVDGDIGDEAHGFDAENDGDNNDDVESDDQNDDTSDDDDDGGKPTPESLQAALAELESLKEVARKWERRAKNSEQRARDRERAAEKKIRDAQRLQMSEQEKALDDARSSGFAEALNALGSQLVAAQIKVRAAGRLDEERVDALIEAIDLRKFIADDGQVRADDVAEFVDRVAPAAESASSENDALKSLLAQLVTSQTSTGRSTGTSRPADLGQGSGRSDIALNSDPILSGLKTALGIR